MKKAKKFVIDYLEGRVDSSKFIETLRSDHSILEWLQSIIPVGTTMLDYKFDECFRMVEKKEVPYDVGNVINGILEQLGETTLGKEYNLHCYIVEVLLRYVHLVQSALCLQTYAMTNLCILHQVHYLLLQHHLP